MILFCQYYKKGWVILPVTIIMEPKTKEEVMKNKKSFVTFTIPVEGSETRNLDIEVEQLREQLKNISLDAESAQINIDAGDFKTSLVMKLSELKKVLKTAELMSEIVPRNLSGYIDDITRKFAMLPKPKKKIVGRDDEIEKVWFYLSQNERNNVFLIGDVDVGKTAIALEIARQISTNECPREFYQSRVLMLNISSLLKITNDFVYEHKVDAVLRFLVKNRKNIILYIDEGIYMKTDEALITMLQKLIVVYHIPIISTMNVKNFETYFLQDSTISKHLNYVYVNEPELEEIEPMLNGYVARLQKKFGIKISKDTIKFGIFTSVLSSSVSSNPGNAKNIFDRAFLEAKRKDKKEVDKHCILSCYDSYWKLYKNITPEEKRGTAYHEAGHYVAFMMCNNVKDQKIAFVSILPMMDFLGVNWPYKIIGKTLDYTQKYFLDYIAIYLAGRVAERMVTFEESTGASNDLTHANDIAEKMILVYGLSDDEDNKNRSFVTLDYHLKTYLMYEERGKRLDKSIQVFIDKGTEIAERIINENKVLVEMIAERLIEEEILTGDELSTIVEKYKETSDF